MSRIGNQPIPIPAGVEVNLEGNNVHVKGGKGELSRQLPEDMRIAVEDGEIVVSRPSDQAKHRAMHGLTRSLVANMVTGVSDGFSKSLEIRGVGYRASLQGKNLVLAVGYSHPVEMTPPEGIEIEVPRPTQVIVRGIDKQLVGETAAKIRRTRQVEPYLGKGIRYENERVRRKAGKAGRVSE